MVAIALVALIPALALGVAPVVAGLVAQEQTRSEEA